MISREVEKNVNKDERVWHDSELNFDNIFTEALRAGNDHLHDQYGINLELTVLEDNAGVFFSMSDSAPPKLPKDDFSSYPIVLDVSDAYFSTHNPFFPQNLDVCGLTGLGMTAKYTPKFAQECIHDVINGIDNALATYPGLATLLKELHPTEKESGVDRLEDLRKLKVTMEDKIDSNFNAPEMRELTNLEIESILKVLLIGLPIEKSCKVYTEDLDRVIVTETLVKVEINNGGNIKVITYGISQDGLPVITVEDYKLE